MFSRAKNDASSDAQDGFIEIGDAPDQTAPKKSPRQEQKSARKNTPQRSTPSVPSLISSDVVITGSMEAEGEVQFDGAIDGNITAKGLVIGEGAMVNGGVSAEKVKVAGTVEGTIRANRVELAPTAIVKGDIIHTALSIENGARFDGTCRHSENPQDDGEQSSVAPVSEEPRQVTQEAPARLSAVENAVTEPDEEQAPVSAKATDREPAEEDDTPTKPVLKSLPGAGGQRQSSPFLNRGGKPDLR